MLSSFRISRDSGVHVFRFTEIPGFGVSGLAAVLVLWISENEAPVFLGVWVSGFQGVWVSRFRVFGTSVVLCFPLCSFSFALGRRGL